MDTATRRLFVAAIVLIIAVTGGAALLLGDPGATPSPSPAGPTASPAVPSDGAAGSPSPDGSTAIPTSPLLGVIVAVDSRGLDDVRAFTLRTEDEVILVFDLRELRSTASFPLGHLAEHLATAEPVLVTFRVEDGVLVATAVDDA
jgi:hypothetical protein